MGLAETFELIYMSDLHRSKHHLPRYQNLPQARRDCLMSCLGKLLSTYRIKLPLKTELEGVLGGLLAHSPPAQDKVICHLFIPDKR